jgi:hypothetical protein
LGADRLKEALQTMGLKVGVLPCSLWIMRGREGERISRKRRKGSGERLRALVEEIGFFYKGEEGGSGCFGRANDANEEETGAGCPDVF